MMAKFKGKSLRLLPWAGTCLVVLFFTACREGGVWNRSDDANIDQSLADSMMALGKQYDQRFHDSAWYYYRYAGTLYLAQDNLTGLADSWYSLINSFKGRKELDSARFYTEKYIELGIEQNDSLKIAKGYYQLGTIFKEMNYHTAGLNYFRKSMALFSGMQHGLGVLANTNYIGSLYKSLHQNDSAAKYYIMALDMCEEQDDEKNSAIVMNNLGDVFLADRQYDMAGEYYTKALEINLRYPDHGRSVALNYNSLGILYGEMNDSEKAMDYYNKSYDLARQLNDTTGMLDVLNNMGDIAFKEGEYALAINYFTKAMEGYQKMNYHRGVLITKGNMASALNKMGNHAEARELNDSIISLASRVNNMDLQMDAYQNMSAIYASINDYRKAYEYMQLTDSIRDIVYGLDKTKLITDLYLNYEKGKADARIHNLEMENLKKTIQSKSVFYTSLGIILLIIFGALFLRQRAVKDKIIAQQRIRQLEEEKKLMAAKMLVEGQEEERKRIARELHDGLGVLLSATKMQFTTIKDLSPENKPLIEKAKQLLEQASGDVRRISHNMMPGLLTRLGFYEAVADLFENLDEMEGLQAGFEIDGEQVRLAENREIMLYRVVQELINNTLKHAGATTIDLKINVSPEQMQLIYRDNGKGFDVDKMLDSDTGSFGLKNILSRISFLNGEAEVKSKPGEGVVYFIRVPVQ